MRQVPHHPAAPRHRRTPPSEERQVPAHRSAVLKAAALDSCSTLPEVMVRLVAVPRVRDSAPSEPLPVHPYVHL